MLNHFAVVATGLFEGYRCPSERSLQVRFKLLQDLYTSLDDFCLLAGFSFVYRLQQHDFLRGAGDGNGQTERSKGTPDLHAGVLAQGEHTL
jgi:hypothetical protein